MYFSFERLRNNMLIWHILFEKVELFFTQAEKSMVVERGGDWQKRFFHFVMQRRILDRNKVWKLSQTIECCRE